MPGLILYHCDPVLLRIIFSFSPILLFHAIFIRCLSLGLIAHESMVRINIIFFFIYNSSNILFSLVWNRLEQENAGFFKAYYTKLVLKKQIAQFNELLENHHNLLSYAAPLEAPLAPMQEGIQHMPGKFMA